jgi:hypothetical protein
VLGRLLRFCSSGDAPSCLRRLVGQESGCAIASARPVAALPPNMQTCHDGRILSKLQLCADRPIAGPYMNADLTVTYSPLALHMSVALSIRPRRSLPVSRITVLRRDDSLLQSLH